MNAHDSLTVCLIDRSPADDVLCCLNELGLSNLYSLDTVTSCDEILNADIIFIEASQLDDLLALVGSNHRQVIVTFSNRPIDQSLYDALKEKSDEILLRPLDLFETKLRLSTLIRDIKHRRHQYVLPPTEISYKRLLELSHDIILQVTNGVITYANAKAHDLLIGQEKEIIGFRLSEIAHEDSKELIEEVLPELAESKKRLPTQFKGKNNTKIHTLMAVSAITEECPNTFLVQAVENSLHKAKIEALLQRERRYKSLVDMSSNMILIVSDSVIIFANPSCIKVLDPVQSGSALIGRPLSSIVEPDYMAIIDIGLPDLAADNESLPLRIHTLQGTTLDVILRVARMESDLSETYLVEIVDVSQQKRAAEALLEREERLSGIVDNAPDAIISMKENGQIESFNNSAVKIFGFSSEEARNMRLHDFVQIGQTDITRDNYLIRECSATEARAVRKDGSMIDVALSIKSMNFGEQKSFIAIIRDVTLQKRDHAELAFLATHDPLTRLPNSHFLLKTLDRMTAENGDTSSCAVLFITLERLNRVNDLFGHQMVDRVLESVANRLNETIGQENIIGRWGGGKFIAIIGEDTATGNISLFCEGIIEALSMPFHIDDNEIVIGCTIGISCYPQDCATPSSLVKNAGMAAFAARQEESGSYLFYTKEMEAEAEERDMLERELRIALSQDQLEVYYQPKIDLTNGKIKGMEALIRWTHPDLGFISPAKFIPIAEETGQIVSIGEWVLNRSCQDTKKWLDLGFNDLKVAVNLSGRQFDEEKLLETVKNTLSLTGLPPTNLELEVTESSLMRDIDQGMRILKSLRNLGITTAIDDFGTGYSSLSYLRRIPLDTLKIDQSFVRNLHIDPDDAAIARTIMDMADNLGLTVVAEGIEIEEHETFLQSIHCHIGQGYYYSKPVPAREFEQLLKTFTPPQSTFNRRIGKDRRKGNERRVV